MPIENSNPARYVVGSQSAGNQVEAASLPSAKADEFSALYYLANHVFARSTRRGVVLLDLLRNKYFGIDLITSESLAGVVRNWPAKRVTGQDAPTVALDGSRMNTLVRSLLDQNVLQLSPPCDCDISRSTFSLEGDLASVGDEIIVRMPVRPAHVFFFLGSLFFAFISLRFLSLSFTVRGVHKRKVRAISKGYCFDAHRAAQLTFVFRRLRPYFFSANGHCVIHALALVNFMAIYGEFPSWVLGVRTEPWGAHSWVQHENFLFDTNPTKVCPYDPLLSI